MSAIEFPTLDRILRPLSVEAFFSDAWQRRAVHCGPSPGRHDALFSRGRFAEFVALVPFPNDALSIALDGTRHDAQSPQHVADSVRSGGTVVFDRVEDFDPTVARYVAAMEGELGERVKIHAFFSQPGRVGFTAHYDTHDIFVLQIEGRKRWRIYEPTISAPLRVIRPARERCPETPYMDVVLEPGDTLYVPRGHWHEPRAVDGESLHVCTGVHPKTGVDFVKWLADELAHDVRFRGAIENAAELRVDDRHETPGAFRRNLDAVITALRERLDDATLADRFAASCRSSLRDRQPVGFDKRANPDLTGSLQVRADAHPRLGDDGQHTLLSVAGHTMRFSRPAAPVLAAVFELGRFDAATIQARCPQFDARELRLVLATLWTAGLVMNA